MASEKDPLGDKLRKKEHAEEERYFQEREKALVERLRKQQEAAQAPRGEPRCPRDGQPLVARELLGVTIEQCPTCQGTWLDHGELETVARREHDSWLGRLFYGPRRS